MRITALVKSHDHVCCRYRIAAYRAHLQALGHDVDVRPWSIGWGLQQLFPGLARSIDALIIQRKLLPGWQLNKLRRRVRWLIYDFDDAVFLHSSYNPRGAASPKRFAQFRHMLQAADVVVAGNDFLHAQAAALTAPGKVVRIPTCVDPARYPLPPQRAEKRSVDLAWIGSSSTLRGLERIRGLLDQLGQRLPHLRLRVICDRPLQLDNLATDFCAWSEATEATDLAEADVGISWLPDDAWSAGKCGLKVLQYMAAGLPVVANPVGVQQILVRHGETGFLAQTPDEWLQAIQLLASDSELRRRMGFAGRQLVEAEYQTTHGAAAWERVLASLHGSAAELAPRGWNA